MHLATFALHFDRLQVTQLVTQEAAKMVQWCISN